MVDESEKRFLAVSAQRLAHHFQLFCTAPLQNQKRDGGPTGRCRSPGENEKSGIRREKQKYWLAKKKIKVDSTYTEFTCNLFIEFSRTFRPGSNLQIFFKKLNKVLIKFWAVKLEMKPSSPPGGTRRQKCIKFSQIPEFILKDSPWRKRQREETLKNIIKNDMKGKNICEENRNDRQRRMGNRCGGHWMNGVCIQVGGKK